MADAIRFAAIGECMVELSHEGADLLRLRHGGDTLNTATYLARIGQDVAVSYITALGDDPYSDAMVAAWRAEGIATDLVARLPGRLPGLYVIRTDNGERSFTYWRSAAAARDLFRNDDTPRIVEALHGFDWLYLSGITLSILDGDSRHALMTALDEARDKGARVAFDGNYRPRGWRDATDAREAMAACLARVDLALPTLDDERLLYEGETADQCADRHHALGVREVAIKDGLNDCLVSSPGGRAHVPAHAGVTPVDTSAAGDSFNAGYLAGRFAGLAPEAAAALGHRLAAAVIQHPGAIIPSHAMPALDLGGAGTMP